MFRISYIDNKTDTIQHKGGFTSDKAAYEWLEKQSDITPLKLLVWSEYIQSYKTLETL